MCEIIFDLQRFMNICNTNEHSLVSGSAENDSIHNTGAYVTIEAGAGNDTIQSEIWGPNAAEGCVIIHAGDGNDSIRSDSTNSTLDGGDGDDSILTWGRVTVIGGKGNDDIVLGANNAYDEHKNLVIYNKGDGNDTIWCFNSDGYNNQGKRLQDTLQIVGADYSTITSGDDLIVKVDKNFITLKYAANNVPVSIIGNLVPYVSDIVWTFKTVRATVTATGKLNGKVVMTITGLKRGTKASDLIVNDSIVTVSKNALSAATVKITGNYILSLADDVNKSEVTTTAGWHIEGTTATYKTLGRTAGYSVASNGKSISYVKSATSKDLTTVTGLKEGVTADDLSLNTSKKIVTLKSNALGTSTITATNNYTFALASDVPKSKTTSGYWTFTKSGLLEKTATYTTTEITEGYILDSKKKSVTYRPASGGEIVATLKGLNMSTTSKDLTIKDGIITLSKKAVTSLYPVTLEGDYTLALAKDVKKSTTTATHWSISGTTAKYIAEKINAGYKISDDKKSVSYIEASGGATLVTITGLKKNVKASALSINNDDKVITLSKATLGTTKVSVKGDYTLALADDVAKTEITDGKFIVNGTTAKYVATQITKGYSLSDDKKSVLYSSAGTNKTLLTITGLKKGTTAEQLSIKNRTVLLAADITGGNGSTVNGADYGFDLTTVGKLVNAGSGASLLGSAGNDTLIGGKGADFISGGNVENSYDYLSGGAGNDTIQGGYGHHTLLGGDGNDYISIVTYVYPDGTYPDSAEKTGNSYLNGGNGNDTVRGGYGNDTLFGGKGNDSLIGRVGNDYLDGGDDNDRLFDSEGQNTLNGNNGNDYIKGTGTLIGGTGNDTLDGVNGNNVLYGGSGKDVLRGNSGNNTLYGGTEADTLYSSEDGGVSYMDGGEGNDVLSCWMESESGDTLIGGAGNDFLHGNSGDNYLDGGTGNDTLWGFNGDKDTLIGGDGNDFLNCFGTMLGGKGNDTLVGNSSHNEYLDGGDDNDFLEATFGGINTLIGGNGNDTLWGWGTLIGGNGNDIFAFNGYEGNALVTDYTSGQDKIQLWKSKLSASKIIGNDVVLTIEWTGDEEESSQTVTLKNARGTLISFINDKGKPIGTKAFISNTSALFDEDNFVTADNLSDIVAEKPVADFEDNQTEKVTQENLITFAK